MCTRRLTPLTACGSFFTWLGVVAWMYTQQGSCWTRASVQPVWEALSHFPGGAGTSILNPNALAILKMDPQPICNPLPATTSPSRIPSVRKYPRHSLSLCSLCEPLMGERLQGLSEMKYGYIWWVQTYHISTDNIIKPTQQNLSNNKVVCWDLQFYYYLFLEKRRKFTRCKVSYNMVLLVA